MPWCAPARRPERQQHEDHEQIGIGATAASTAGMRPGSRGRSRQAGDDQAQKERAPEQRCIDPLVLVLPDDLALVAVGQGPTPTDNRMRL